MSDNHQSVVGKCMRCAAQPQERDGSMCLSQFCAHSWLNSAGVSQSHKMPLCPRCCPYFLHWDNNAIQDCEHNKHHPTPPFHRSVVNQFLSGFSDPIGFEGRAAGRLSSLGITPAWVFGLAIDRTLERFRVLCACVCVCRICAREGKYGSVHLPRPPEGNGQKG